MTKLDYSRCEKVNSIEEGEEYLAFVYDFFVKKPDSYCLTGETNAFIIFEEPHKNKSYLLRHKPCHYSFLNSDNYPLSSVGSQFFVLEETRQVGEKFWKWISDPDISPWKKLFQKGTIKLLRNKDDLPFGWTYSGKGINEVPFNFIKNFAIATRMISEKPKKLECWSLFCDKGVHPGDAWFLTTVVTGSSNSKNIVSDDTMGSRQGGHWPLSDCVSKIYYHGQEKPLTRFLDFKKIKTGEVDFNINPKQVYGNYYYDIEPINGFFQDTSTKDRKIFTLKDHCTLNTNKGRFSNASSFNIDDVIEGFYKWKDQEGINI